MTLLNRRTVVTTLLGAVAYGLVARLAFSESLPIAVPMTFAFIFLVPLAVGYLTVAAAPPGGQRAMEAVLLPLGAVFMVLAAVMAIGVEGMICVVMMTPIFLLMALLGSGLAHLVRSVRSRRMRSTALLVVLMLPYAAGPLEQRLPQAQSRRVVESRIRIQADPAEVGARSSASPPSGRRSTAPPSSTASAFRGRSRPRCRTRAWAACGRPASSAACCSARR